MAQLMAVGAGGRPGSRDPSRTGFRRNPRRHTDVLEVLCLKGLATFQSGTPAGDEAVRYTNLWEHSQINPSGSCFFRSELWEGTNSLINIRVLGRCASSALEDSKDPSSLYRFTFPLGVCGGALPATLCVRLEHQVESSSPLR